MEEPSTRSPPSKPMMKMIRPSMFKNMHPPPTTKAPLPLSTVPSIILDEDQEGVTAIDVDIVDGREAVAMNTPPPPTFGRRRRLKRERLIQMARERLQLMSEEFFN